MSRLPEPSFLEDLFRRHHRVENLFPDPLVFARGYPDPLDGEVAGLVAAALAYGRVEKIMEALEGVFRILGKRPRKTLAVRGPGDLVELFDGFAYRFHKGRDVALLLHLVAQALARRESLGAVFQAGDRGAELGPALCAFVDELLSGDPRPILPGRTIPPGHPIRHFLPSPARGGAAKRLCLYLRWMVRKDALDPGYWQGRVDPAHLVVPLDTHVARVGRDLAFTSRRAADWKTACEITEALKRYDPLDPVRFDFSLFRFGMGRHPGAADCRGVRAAAGDDLARRKAT